jgi:hypothetical protein
MARGTLGAAIGLLVVAGALIDTPTDAQAVAGLNTVTISPGHGKAAAQFQVSYVISPCQQAAGLTIGFSWNGLTPSGQVLGTALTDITCRATLSTKPPVNSATHQPPAPGTYQVFGYVALPTGSPAPNTEASASYAVDVTPAATATASSSATARATSAPSATAPADTAASPLASPASSDQPRAAGMAQSTGDHPTVIRSSGHPGWWRLSWPVTLRVGLLALAILAAIALLLVRRRRARAAPGHSKGKAA